MVEFAALQFEMQAWQTCRLVVCSLTGFWNCSLFTGFVCRFASCFGNLVSLQMVQVLASRFDDLV